MEANDVSDVRNERWQSSTASGYQAASYNHRRVRRGCWFPRCVDKNASSRNARPWSSFDKTKFIFGLPPNGTRRPGAVPVQIRPRLGRNLHKFFSMNTHKHGTNPHGIGSFSRARYSFVRDVACIAAYVAGDLFYLPPLLLHGQDALLLWHVVYLFECATIHGIDLGLNAEKMRFLLEPDQWLLAGRLVPSSWRTLAWDGAGDNTHEDYGGLDYALPGVERGPVGKARAKFASRFIRNAFQHAMDTQTQRRQSHVQNFRENTPQVYFVTDVEGDYEYWRTCVEACVGLALPRWVPGYSSHPGGICLDRGIHFVFGGDVCDHGDGSIRIVNELLALHRHCPERVHILLGNRDINKLRLTSELAPSELVHDHLDLLPGPYWVLDSDRITPKDYIKKLVMTQNNSGATNGRVDSKMREADTLTNRLRFILDCTMGARDDFEYRRHELARLEVASVDNVSVSDEKVAQSYLRSLAKHGFMRQLISRGKIACIIGDSLFVHGGVSGWFRKFGSSVLGSAAKLEKQSALGCVPGCRVPYSSSEAVEWVQHLNDWKEGQMRAWGASPHWEGSAKNAAKNSCNVITRRRRGGDDLIDYVVSGCVPSVVLGRHIDPEGNPERLDHDVALWLKEAGIRRVVCGHTPVGCCPHLSHEAHGLQLICADTSYSNNKPTDKRGRAWGLITVWPHADSAVKVRMEGMTHEGKLYKTDVGGSKLATSGDACVGRVTRDGRFVKQRLLDGKYLLYRVEKRRNFFYTYEGEEHVRSLLGLPPARL